MKFNAVAFDLDGTLYPNYRFYIRLLPFLLKNQRLLRAMGKARAQLRKYGGYGDDFYETQAAIMGKVLGESTESAKEKTERLIYRGWEPIFKKVKLFPYVKETLEAFRKAGIKLGLLSDFPVEAKLVNLGISGYWDTVLSSELTGRLKPDPSSFLELAKRMEMPPDQILYVGNSLPYDVEGAQKAGMKAGFVRTGWKKLKPIYAGVSKSTGRVVKTGRILGTQPDICFSDYRQLTDYVLN